LKIYSIVVTYNGSKFIKDCFGSLINSKVINHSILAIDNGSNDDTVSLIRKYFPQVEIIENGKNLGFGKANNIGLKKALNDNADYVFLLNQDAWLEGVDTLDKLIDLHQKNQDYGIISPIHLNKSGKIDEGFLNYISRDKNSLFLSNISEMPGNINLYSCNGINAAAWLISKQCLEKIGGFMPLFYHYAEDDNYCQRVLKSGLKIGFASGIIIIHDRESRKTKYKLKDKINKNYRKYLSVFTSINHKSFWDYLLFVFKNVMNIIWNYKKDPFKLLYLIVIIPMLIFNSFTIYNQRKKSKRIFPNFLK